MKRLRAGLLGRLYEEARGLYWSLAARPARPRVGPAELLSRTWSGDEGRRGSVAVLVGLMLVMIIGFVSLGSEVVLLLLTSRQMQSAADSGALGAVSAKLSGNPADYRQEAFALAAAGGFASGQTTTCPDPTAPATAIVYAGIPCDGAHASDTDYVEVLIREPQMLALANVVYPGPFTASGRAVAHVPTGGACLLALNPSASPALFVHGGATVNLNGCGGWVDSTSPNAVQISGANSTLCTPDLRVAGGISGTIDPSPPCPAAGTTTTNAASVANPYADIPTPPASGCLPFSFTGGRTQTINPGCIEGTLSLSGGAGGSGGGGGSGKILNLCPGIYVIDNGNLSVASGNTLRSVPGSTAGCTNPTAANGVTIVMTGANPGSVNFFGGANLNLIGLAVASTSPIMPAGTLFFQDPHAPSGTAQFNGGTTQTLQGVLYFPNQTVQFNGGTGTTSPCTEIIAGSFDFGGAATTLTNTTCPTGTLTLGDGQPQLVE